MKKLSVLIFVLVVYPASVFAQVVVSNNPLANGKVPTISEKQFLAITKLNQPIRNPEFEQLLLAITEGEAARLTGVFSEEALVFAPTVAPTVSVVNTASQVLCPSPGATSSRCTNGQFITAYVSHQPTTDLGSFSYPWKLALADGFKLRFESCGNMPNNARDTAILGVYDLGGYFQINAYVPGDSLVTQGEPHGGVCNAITGPTTVTFNVSAPPGTPFYTANTANNPQSNFFQQVGMQLWSPGIFTANGVGNGAPAWSHLNFSTQTYTSLSVCNANPNLCPITTGGVPNYLVIYTTGAENMQCGFSGVPSCPNPPPGSPATGQNIGFKVGANVQYFPNPIFVGEVYLGQEQWNVPLNTLPPGSYKITARFGVQDLAAQALDVAFGPGN